MIKWRREVLKGGLNKQGEEKNRVPDTAHDCPILRIGVMHEQPVSERENLSKWELFYFFHSLSLHHKPPSSPFRVDNAVWKCCLAGIGLVVGR